MAQPPGDGTMLRVTLTCDWCGAVSSIKAPCANVQVGHKASILNLQDDGWRRSATNPKHHMCPGCVEDNATLEFPFPVVLLWGTA